MIPVNTNWPRLGKLILLFIILYRCKHLLVFVFFLSPCRPKVLLSFERFVHWWHTVNLHCILWFLRHVSVYLGEAKKIVFHSSEDFRGFEIQLVQHDWSSLTASTVTSNRSARLRAVRQLLKEPSKTVVDETPLFDGRCYRCNVISLTLNLIFPANFDHLRLTREQQGWHNWNNAFRTSDLLSTAVNIQCNFSWQTLAGCRWWRHLRSYR